ncbi:hypothetical protein BKA82DRAFT_994318 [Pisolithus tinctorius]|uniref:Uncharacterized protein n=1 Tax=Pisolithus tinctorius Marx 270 TaxID=870435 RepID=A0A0C3PR93_PISTI|nr:hypothetical protein BKA82DRAFT_994318 [Pisolithus tinctorius]KIO11571.1 hypothetical protein M404DRAFT_994318 [Pisolithus tinctorius Marx 270]
MEHTRTTGQVIFCAIAATVTWAAGLARKKWSTDENRRSSMFSAHGTRPEGWRYHSNSGWHSIERTWTEIGALEVLTGSGRE